jgi:recombination protein RecA
LDMATAAELRTRLEQALEHRIPRAFTPPQRPSPERMLTDIASIDALTGGIPLGCLTEICGPSSSGRTSILHQILAEFMRRDEMCAFIDVTDAFDPQSAASAGVELGKLLWVRCRQSGDRVTSTPATAKPALAGGPGIGSSGEVKRHSAFGTRHSAKQSQSHPQRRETPKFFSSPDDPITRWPDPLSQSLKATDLLLQAGGFGLIVLDLGDIPVAAARRIPLTTWFRFRRAVENTSTAFIVLEQHPHAKSCATLVMDLTAQQASWSEASDQNEILMGAHAGNPAPLFRVTAEGIAIPFEQPAASSFTMPQRWSTPHARLLNTLHVHLQVTRSRNPRNVHKFPAASESVIPSAAVARGIPTTSYGVSVQ